MKLYKYKVFADSYEDQYKYATECLNVINDYISSNQSEFDSILQSAIPDYDVIPGTSRMGITHFANSDEVTIQFDMHVSDILNWLYLDSIDADGINMNDLLDYLESRGISEDTALTMTCEDYYSMRELSQFVDDPETIYDAFVNYAQRLITHDDDYRLPIRCVDMIAIYAQYNQYAFDKWKHDDQTFVMLQDYLNSSVSRFKRSMSTGSEDNRLFRLIDFMINSHRSALGGYPFFSATYFTIKDKLEYGSTIYKCKLKDMFYALQEVVNTSDDIDSFEMNLETMIKDDLPWNMLEDRTTSFKDIVSSLSKEYSSGINSIYEQTYAGQYVDNIVRDVENKLGIYGEPSVQNGRGSIVFTDESTGDVLFENDYEEWCFDIIRIFLSCKSEKEFISKLKQYYDI